MIDITNARLIERQHRMMGLGLMAAQIDQIMRATDEMIAKSIADAERAIPAMSGEKLDRAEKLLKAFEIEAALRKQGL